MIRVLLIGLFVWICDMILIKIAEHFDKEIGKLRFLQAAILFVLSLLGPVLSEDRSNLMLLACFSLFTVLLFSSYTDAKSGMVFLIPILGAVGIETLYTLKQWVTNALSTKDVLAIAGFMVILFVLVLTGLARADGLLYFACIEYLFSCFSTYQGVGCMFFIFFSSVFALVGQCISRKGTFKKAFPFTSYLCAGFYVALILMQLSK